MVKAPMPLSFHNFADAPFRQIPSGFARSWGKCLPGFSRYKVTSRCSSGALGCHRVGPPGDSEDRHWVPEAVWPGTSGPAATVAVECSCDGSGRHSVLFFLWKCGDLEETYPGWLEVLFPKSSKKLTGIFSALTSVWIKNKLTFFNLWSQEQKILYHYKCFLGGSKYISFMCVTNKGPHLLNHIDRICTIMMIFNSQF